MPSTRKRVTKARESRRRLLDVGRTMVHETPIPNVLDHIRLSRVARRAGVSTGALYHYWDSQEQYREELLGELLSPRRYPIDDSIEELVRGAALEGVPIAELVRSVCQDNVDQFSENEDFRVQIAFWVSDSPEVQARIALQYAVVAEQWVAFYQLVFDAYGLVMRPPFTFDGLATLLTGLLEGLIIRHRVDPSAVPLGGIEGDDGETWSLFSCAVLALLPGMTQAADETLDDVWMWVTRLTSPRPEVR